MPLALRVLIAAYVAAWSGLAVVTAGAVSYGGLAAWQAPAQRGFAATVLLGSLAATMVVRRLVLERVHRLELPFHGGTVAMGAIIGFATAVFAAVLLGAPTPPATYLATAFAVVLTGLLIGEAWLARHRRAMIVLVPHGRIAEIAHLPNLACHVLAVPGRLPDAAVVVDRHHRMDPVWTDFLADCETSEVPVLSAEVAYERLTGRVSLRYLRSASLEAIGPDPWWTGVKRIAELSLIVVLLPILLPVAAVTALAIRLDSRGPVLFWQERVGRHGRPFRMAKFRSMRVDADQGGARFAERDDGRITRVGRVIRKVRLDELPQLYNVVRGEMSLVGPRPEQVPFVEAFQASIPFYGFRHLVRPGLTGWAQVRAGYASDEAGTYVKLEHDLYYVKHLSPWLDLWIVVLTLRTVLTGFGAR